MTPEEVRAVLDRHRWREGEREQLQADIAERTAHREAGMDAPSWAAAAPEQAVVRKTVPVSRTGAADAWNQHVAAMIEAHERALLGAIADVVAEESGKLQDANKALAADLEALQRRLAQLEARLEAKGAPALRAVGE
jgi:hypothetical protein